MRLTELQELFVSFMRLAAVLTQRRSTEDRTNMVITGCHFHLLGNYKTTKSVNPVNPRMRIYEKIRKKNTSTGFQKAMNLLFKYHPAGVLYKINYIFE